MSYTIHLGEQKVSFDAGVPVIKGRRAVTVVHMSDIQPTGELRITNKTNVRDWQLQASPYEFKPVSGSWYQLNSSADRFVMQVQAQKSDSDDPQTATFTVSKLALTVNQPVVDPETESLIDV